MRFYIIFLFICAIVWLSTFIHGCKSKSKSSPRKPKTTTVSPTNIPVENTSIGGLSSSLMSSIAEDEKNEDDETEDDVDEEDFELICDGHVPQERMKATPEAIIMGAKKGGTQEQFPDNLMR